MRYLLSILIFSLLLSCAETGVSTDLPENGQPIQSEHFTIVLFDGLSSHTAVPVLSKLNDNYSRILGDLSVSSIPTITIEIWNDETHFQNDMKRDLGINYWGATGYIYGATTLRILNRGNVPQAALHEFAHIVSLHINKQIANNPRWLWEATAIYEAGEFVHPRSISYLAAGDFPTLSELNTDYNQGNQKIYAVGYLLAEYIVETWGRGSLVQMIALHANLAAVLGVTAGQFEAGWKEFVVRKYSLGS